MLPGRVGNKITTPAMRQLVGYHVNVLTVLEYSSQPWHHAHRPQVEGKRGDFYNIRTDETDKEGDSAIHRS